jgi:hypothetical protein
MKTQKQCRKHDWQLALAELKAITEDDKSLLFFAFRYEYRTLYHCPNCGALALQSSGRSRGGVRAIKPIRQDLYPGEREAVMVAWNDAVARGASVEAVYRASDAAKVTAREAGKVARLQAV